jgi:hypothetical protein
MKILLILGTFCITGLIIFLSTVIAEIDERKERISTLFLGFFLISIVSLLLGWAVGGMEGL